MMKYEKWSLGYWTLKQYVRFVDWIIHNKTIMIGMAKIPANKPILFAPNHQNALSDPMAVLLNTRFQPVWLARADIFKNKTAAAILRFLKIMPVYRMRDGKDNLAKNDTTFGNSIKVLESHGALALFPEAAHTGKRQMISHKKAVPRIVFMAEEKTDQDLDIQIIPTGIYYSSYWKFNRNLIVNFGDPIPANQFLNEYKENPNAATLTMRESIYAGIEPLVFDIRSKNYYEDFELITDIYGEHFLANQGQKNSIVNLFKSNQKLAKSLDKLEAENPAETKNLVEQANAYSLLVKKYKLRSWLVENPQNNFLRIILNKLILLLGLPIFVFGFLLNAIPFFTIDTIIRKKIKEKAFWSTFSLGIGMFLFPIIYLLELLALSWLIPGIWLKLVFLISLPFAGKLAFKWYIIYRKTLGRARLFFLKIFDNSKYQHLINSKENLFKELDRLFYNYL
jgi:1-acyl-sn-glycerol-3-phosphate acyltransferase